MKLTLVMIWTDAFLVLVDLRALRRASVYEARVTETHKLHADDANNSLVNYKDDSRVINHVRSLV